MKTSLIQEDQCSVSTNNDLATFQSNSHRSVFVRDLPFACTSQILKCYFFESLGVTIEKALVCENKKGRNLQFGCVLFSNEEHVKLAIERLNNSRIQGRNIRILRFDPAAPSETSSTGSIHVSFKTIVPKEQLTEENLQEAFAEFGEVEHVSIRSLKFSDDGLQGGYGFLSFKTEAENKRAVELCYQRVINGVIFDCQWSQKNPRDRNPEGKYRSDRLNVRKITTTVDQTQSNGSDSISRASPNNARRDRTIRASSNASIKLFREESSSSLKQQINAHENTKKFSEIPPIPALSYPVPTMPAMNTGLNSFSTSSPGAQHYSPSPGYTNSPIPSLNYSPIVSSNVLHGSSIPSSHQMQAQPTMHLIPQQYAVASSQQYFYGVSPNPNPNDSHQGAPFAYSTHQGQQVLPRYSAANVSHRSPTHQSPNPLPSGFYVSLPPNSSSPTQNGMSPQPQYSTAIHSDDRSAAVFNHNYNNPSYSIPQPLPVNPEISHPAPVMVAGMHVNMSPQGYYANYYPVNPSIPVPLYSSTPYAQPVPQSTPGTHNSNHLHHSIHPLHLQNHHHQNSTSPPQGNDWYR
jgi:RNA recognition motif-containing protein